MTAEKKTNQIKIILPLIALCLPLFANYNVKAENACPYKTYIHVDDKCMDISAEGLQEITEEIDSDAVADVSQEIKDVSEELSELSTELNELCDREAYRQQPQTTEQTEAIEDVCQD